MSLKEKVKDIIVAFGVGEQAENAAKDDRKKENVAEKATKNQQTHALDSPVNVSGEIRVGLVVEAYPTINQYLVFSVSNKTQHLCSNISDIGASLFGVRSASTIPTGSIVLYFLDHTNFGYILGSIFQPIKLVEELFGDKITNFPITLGDFKPYKDFLRNAQFHIFGAHHVDSFSHGEFNKYSATGTMIHIDNFMAFLRASEHCGIWAFHSDNLLRTIAENYDFWSRGVRETLRNDPIYLNDEEKNEEEIKYFIRKNILEVVSEQEIRNLVYSFHNNFSYYGGDPSFPSNEPFSKLVKFSGGISNIEKEFVMSVVGTNTGNKEIYNLLEINKNCTGIYSLKTARGFLFLSVFDKDYLFRLTDVEDPFGDFLNNYNLSIPLIKTLKIPDSYNSLKGENPDLPSVHASGIIDRINFHYNEESRFRFRKHQFDFKSADPRNLFNSPILDNDCTSTARKTFSFPKKIGVDPAVEEINIEESEELDVVPKPAFYTVLEDGTQIMGNGYGCEIRMEKDTLYIRAPKIHIQSGDELSIWGANGLYQRSNGEIQIVSTKNDISIKARKDLKMVGGNFGEAESLTEEGKVMIISYGEHLILSNQRNLKSSEGGTNTDHTFIDIRKNSIKLKAKSTPEQKDSENNQIKSYIQTDSDELHLFAQKIDCEQKDTNIPTDQFSFVTTSQIIFPQPLWHQLYIMCGIENNSIEWKEFSDPVSGSLPWGTNDNDKIYKQSLGYTSDMNNEGNQKYGDGSLELNKDKFPRIKRSGE